MCNITCFWWKTILKTKASAFNNCVTESTQKRLERRETNPLEKIQWKWHPEKVTFCCGWRCRDMSMSNNCGRATTCRSALARACTNDEQVRHHRPLLCNSKLEDNSCSTRSKECAQCCASTSGADMLCLTRRGHSCREVACAKGNGKEGSKTEVPPPPKKDEYLRYEGLHVNPTTKKYFSHGEKVTSHKVVQSNRKVRS